VLDQSFGTSAAEAAHIGAAVGAEVARA